MISLPNHRFEGEICVIYPPELTLKKTTESGSYLDVAISISGGRFVMEYLWCVCLKADKNM